MLLWLRKRHRLHHDFEFTFPWELGTGRTIFTGGMMILGYHFLDTVDPRVYTLRILARVFAGKLRARHHSSANFSFCAQYFNAPVFFPSHLNAHAATYQELPPPQAKQGREVTDKPRFVVAADSFSAKS